jgi:hypothetical protein
VRDLFPILRESGELSAVILLVVSLAGIFAFSLSTLGVIDPITNAIVNSGLGEYGVLSLLILLLITVGMFLDGISIFLIFVPLLLPIMHHYHWDPVWFGVILTLKVALGQFTPPMAVNLMVSCRIAGVRMEDTTVRWVGPMLLAMCLVMVLRDRLPAAGAVAAGQARILIKQALALLLLLLFTKERKPMKLRTFLTSAVAAAAPWPSPRPPPWRSLQERIPHVAGARHRLSPGARAASSGPTRCASAPGPHQHQALPRRLADPGRPDARVLRAAPGRDRHGRGLDHQLVAAGQAAQPVLAALPDARLRRHRRADAGRGRQEPVQTLDKAGVVPLAWGENGYREISNSKHAIKTPADLKGMKIRVVGSPLFLDTFTALGANPTQMSWADAQPAMASGAVDGQENPLPSSPPPSCTPWRRST